VRLDPPDIDAVGPGLPPVPPAPWITTVVGAVPVRRATLVRLTRYSAVSVVSTATSLVTLGVLVGLVGLPAMWANVMATAAGTVPSFELNRRWVWGNEGRRSLFGQVVPFVALSFTGLAISTLAVGVVSAHASGWGHWTRTAAVLVANVTAYGMLWVVQYQILQRLLFSHDYGPPDARREVS
jgi:putative flippase GtrA